MQNRVGYVVIALLAGCGASAGSIAELKDELDRCEVDVELPEDLTEERAECALGCIDGDCWALEEQLEFGDSYVGDCIRNECKFDLFPDKPEISFGEDTGTLSTSGEELFEKTAGNPNPNTLVGLYEATGSGWDSVGFNILDNVWRVRNEIRQDGIVMGIECSFAVSGEASDARTYYAFVTSPIEVHDWGIRILESSTDDAPYTAYGFDAHCSVELNAGDWPFCLKQAGVPDDYTSCVTVREGDLTIVTRDGDVQSSASQGTKIAN